MHGNGTADEDSLEKLLPTTAICACVCVSVFYSLSLGLKMAGQMGNE